MSMMLKNPDFSVVVTCWTASSVSYGEGCSAPTRHQRPFSLASIIQTHLQPSPRQLQLEKPLVGCGRGISRVGISSLSCRSVLPRSSLQLVFCNKFQPFLTDAADQLLGEAY